MHDAQTIAWKAVRDQSPCAARRLIGAAGRKPEDPMDRTPNPRLDRLEVLVGDWELTATSGEKTMSTSRSTFRWLGDCGFLIQRVDPPTYLTPEWVGAAPTWVDAVIGLDDYRTLIEARWEASGDGHDWSTDFTVTYRRL
jgi:hypothetical protein